jgi:hypothetical protein
VTDQRGLPRPGTIIEGCSGRVELCTIGADEDQATAIANCPGGPVPPPLDVLPRFTGEPGSVTLRAR